MKANGYVKYVMPNWMNQARSARCAEQICEAITMLTTDTDRAICAKYSARDEAGYVHCHECPLARDGLMCKAAAHYDSHLREWVMDEEGKHE